MSRVKPTYEELEIKIRELEKKLKQKNKLSEQTYKNLYRSTPAIMHSTNNKGEIVDVSNKWLTELGYSPEEVIGKKSVQFLTEKSRKKAIEKYFPIFWKEGHIENIEYQFIKKDGSIIDVLLSTTSERDIDGNIFRTLAILEDITQRKKDREAILDSQKRYQSIFYNSPIPLWEEDFTELFEFIELKQNQGVNDFEKYLDENPEEVLLCSQKIKIIDVNNAAIKLHEAKSKDELLGNLDKIFTDKSIVNFKDEVIALANGQTEFKTEGEVKTLKGNTRKILLRLINNSKTQSSTNVIVATLDITERIKAEEELRITREQYKNLFDNAQVGLFSVDLKSGRFIEANNHAAHIAGYNNLEIFKKEYITKEHYVIPKLREEVQEQLKNNGNILNFPIEMFGKGKRRYWIELSGKMNSDNGLFEGAIIDITDRKHAEKALVESQERFHLAMKATKDGLYDWNLLTNEIYYSPGYKSMLGYEDHEIKNDFSSWENLTHPDDVKKSRSMLKDHLERKIDRFELDFKMKHKNGNWMDIRSRANAIFDENDKPIRVIGTHIDITEQKQVNKILDQERKLTQHYLDIAGVMLIAINKNQKVTLINPKGCDVLGYSREEVIGKNWFDNFLPQENIDQVKSVFNQIISKGVGDARYFENPILRKDGSQRIVAWHNALFDDEYGNIIGLFSSGTDITERIEAETIILNERQRAKNILQGTNAGTWDWNIQTEEIIINDQWATMLGYSLKEIEPLALDLWKSMMHPDDIPNTEKAIENHFNKKDDYYDTEFRMSHKKGNWIWINARGKIVEWTDDGKPLRMSGVHIDINKHKFAELELVKAKEKAEESDRLKSAFMANMSHEIRTPMNGIIGFADLLKEPQLSTDKQLRYITVIQKSGQRMLNIINDLIDISKIEAGQMEIDIVKTNVNEKIEYLYSFFKPEAIDKGLHLFYKMQLQKHRSIIETDKDKLLAILINLLKNAIKYTNEGSIEFGYKIKSKNIEFYVKDTGIGIPEEHHKLIFERFTQADMSITKPYEGAGLGLSITKAYIELLGGTIWLESIHGKGTTFYFTLPLKEGKTTKQIINQSIKIPNDASNIENLVILTAEDDDIAGIYLSEILKKRCKKLIQVKNGNEAVEICKTNTDIDLVLMDMKMPEMDGYEATRLIRKFNKDIVIIAQTAYALQEDRDKVIDAGCNDYISKPIKITELLNLLKTYIKN